MRFLGLYCQINCCVLAAWKKCFKKNFSLRLNKGIMISEIWINLYPASPRILLPQRLLVFTQSGVVARFGHVEGFGQAAVEKANALELVKTR